MATRLRFKPVDKNSLKETTRIEEFGKSFDHPILTWRFPYLEIIKDDKTTIGFAQIVSTPILFCGWHPEFSKPIDTFKGTEMLKNWAHIQYGHGLTTVPLNTKTFLPKNMEKMGFTRMGLELYEIT